MEVVAPVRKAILGVQMLFVAFGALVLVPLLTGLDPSLALLTAGAGTLVFQLITGGKVPIFLASSFAFIAPIQYGVKTFGVAATLGSLICTGIVYVILSTGVRLGGIGTIKKYLPPIVTGPVIMVIGLNLAPVAVRMARSFDGSGCMDPRAMALSSLSLATAIIAVMFGKGLIRMIPILCGIAVGYAAAFFMGVVDFSAFHNAAWFTNPWDAAVRSGAFAVPTFEWAAILFMLPVAIAPSIEHVGDILAISSVTGKDYLKDPGLHRTLLGDGLATSLAALLGGPPNTTYSEVTGAVVLTGFVVIARPIILSFASAELFMLALFHHIQAVMGMLCRFFHPGQPLGHLLPFGFRIRQLAAKFCDTVPEAPHRFIQRLDDAEIKDDAAEHQDRYQGCGHL